jgi:hypothetical protein
MSGRQGRLCETNDLWMQAWCREFLRGPKIPIQQTIAPTVCGALHSYHLQRTGHNFFTGGYYYVGLVLPRIIWAQDVGGQRSLPNVLQTKVAH